MHAEPRPPTVTNTTGRYQDAADYLAAILPELASLARNGGLEELGVTIDKAADLARTFLIRRAD